MTEVSLVKRLLILAAGSLLILSAAACQREKPPAVEPTLPIPTVVGQAVATPNVPGGAVTAPATLLPTTPGVPPQGSSTLATNTPVVVTTGAPTAAALPPGAGATTYTVQLGDTLYAIAAKYGVTIQQIQAANPGLNPNQLIPGTVLIIPAPSATAVVTPAASEAATATSTPLGYATAVPSTGTTAGACPSRYTVQRGDWWYAIARKCGVTVEALQAANPGVNPKVVYPGQVLNIPGGTGSGSGTTPPTPSAGSGTTYTVKAGDTLFGIAVRFGKTVYQLQVANHLANPNAIYPGQVLIIPQ